MVADGRGKQTVSTITGNGNGDELADYERAISITGYGTFNVLLFLAALPIAWTSAFDTTSGAFVLASAECDLQLTFFRKGLLVAFPYIAMILTSFVWEHVAVYVGRRTLFVLGLLADSLVNLSSTAVTSYYLFLLLKFVNGVIVGGPFAMLTAYLTEFHAVKYKAKFARWAGLMFTIPFIAPAALAFTILPLELSVDIFGRDYDSWRIYLLVCSMPPVLGLVTAALLPESPKRLIALGKHQEAMKLLRRMYSMNTGKPADAFPFKGLYAPRKPLASEPVLEKIRTEAYNARLLLSTRHAPAFSFVGFLQFASMLGFHTMRLWVPHMFIILNNFDAEYWTPADRAATMCEMLDRRAAVPARPYLNCSTFEHACYRWHIRPIVYQNSTIIAASAVLFSFLAGFVATTRLGKKILLHTAFLISVLSSFGVNWAQAPPYMLTLSAAIIVTTRITGNVVNAVNGEVIPIPLRATSLSIITAMGNFGAVVGNCIFSALLGSECLAAFMGLGCLFSACFCLSLFLPQPAKPTTKILARPDAPS